MHQKAYHIDDFDSTYFYSGTIKRSAETPHLFSYLSQNFWKTRPKKLAERIGAANGALYDKINTSNNDITNYDICLGEIL